jgi:hypothetical protein
MLAVHDGPAMHAKPFVPLTAVSQPLGVNTKTDASFEMPSGAALRASAIAAFRSIKYSESGSIFGYGLSASCARVLAVMLSKLTSASAPTATLDAIFSTFANRIMLLLVSFPPKMCPQVLRLEA